MRIAVLGGTVFIGRAIVEDLVAAGHEVVVVHRGVHEPEGDDAAGYPDVRHVHVDRAALTASTLADFDPEAVIDTICMERPDAEVACAAFGADVRLVVLSSGDVYRAFASLNEGGASDPLPISETSAVRDDRFPYRGVLPDMDDYSKLDVEEVYLARGGCALRLPMVYGERDRQRREEFVLRRVRAGRKRIPFGSGTWLGPRGYVRDIATGARLAAEQDTSRGEVFNLGEPATWAVRQWAEQILAAAGSDAELVTVPDDALPPDMGLTGAVAQHVLMDSSKAGRLLGWSHRPAAEAVPVSVAWHLDHPPQADDLGFEADDTALSVLG